MIWLYLLLIEIIVEASSTSLIPYTYNPFLTDLTQKSPKVFMAFGLWILVRCIYQLAQSVKNYLQIRYMLTLRTHRTMSVLWQRDKFKKVTNIPQRIQEDIKLSYLNRIQVYTEYAISAIMVVILCTMYFSKHWQLVFYALLYASASLGIALCFRPKLLESEMIVQNAEADFRTGMVNKLYFHVMLYLKVVTNNIRSAKIRLFYNNFMVIQQVLSFVLPYLFLIPLVLNGKETIGDMFEYTQAFGLIVVNFDILIQLFQQLTQGHASEQRIKELL